MIEKISIEIVCFVHDSTYDTANAVKVDVDEEISGLSNVAVAPTPRFALQMTVLYLTLFLKKIVPREV